MGELNRCLAIGGTVTNQTLLQGLYRASEKVRSLPLQKRTLTIDDYNTGKVYRGRLMLRPVIPRRTFGQTYDFFRCPS